MKAFLCVCMVGFAMASQGVTEGLKAVVERRQNMKRVERPVAQRMDNGMLLSVYKDGSVTTQSVSMVRMSPATTLALEGKTADRETLKAAKALVLKIKEKHRKKVEGLSDSEIVSASESVFSTSGKDAATGAAVGVLLGAAATIIKNKKPKKDKES